MDTSRSGIDIRIAPRWGRRPTLVATAIVAVALATGISVGRTTVHTPAVPGGSVSSLIYERGPQAHMSALHHRQCVVP